MQSSYDRMRQQQLMQQQADTLRAQQQYYQAAAMNMNIQNADSYYRPSYQPAPYVDPCYQQSQPHYGNYGHYGSNQVSPSDIAAMAAAAMLIAAMTNGCDPDIY